jgi:alpha-tubulin suppressor-like RCC1 family protein
VFRAGACGYTCAAGFADCDGSAANGCEANLQTSAAACGACGSVCPTRPRTTATCAAGRCGAAPDAGWGDCDGDVTNGAETSLATSASHCGACGRACAGAANTVPTCLAGACAAGPCAAGFADCDRNPANGCEVDLRSNASSCGACGAACPAGGACAAGVCACPAGATACAGVCRATATDAGHCGACGRACALANATAACAGGGCVIASCAAGYADCDGNAANGCEVDTRTHTQHCGACRNVCPAATGATAVCAAGVCAVSTAVCTPSTRADCDRVSSNGCEVDTTSDAAHCGACGSRCAYAHAAATCAAGRCAMGACDAGWADCDRNATNGCEVDTRASAAHCGACGGACPAGGACSAGVCACPAGWTVCSAACRNTAVDASHCGTCGRTCALANATAACAGGGCVIASCSPGYADCDGTPSNGCEVDLRTDASNCGACARRCAAANAMSTCVAGACDTRCNPGWADCDRASANGCEVDTRTDPGHCGACGAACAGGINGGPAVACAAGACGDLAQVASGSNTVCARRSAGAALCWGQNAQQQAGAATPARLDTPTLVVGVTGALQLALGDTHGIARGPTMRAWGTNTYGQIATQYVVTTPLAVSGCCSAPRAVSVVAGWEHSCAVNDAGGVGCWGRNQRGQLGDGTTTTAAAGAISAAVTARTATGALAGVASLALGRYHTCALTATQRVYCWGDNTYGELGRAASAAAQTTALPVLDAGGAELTGVQEIAAGDGFTCARISGAVRCWGDNLRGSTGSPSGAREVATPTVVPDITDATAIAAGQFFACALRTGGRVHCWGGNLDGQAGQPASSVVYASALSLARYADGAAVTDAVSLALGASHACAATAQGALVCWGRNYDAQLGDGTRVSRDRAARARWPVY